MLSEDTKLRILEAFPWGPLQGPPIPAAFGVQWPGNWGLMRRAPKILRKVNDTYWNIVYKIVGLEQEE